MAGTNNKVPHKLSSHPEAAVRNEVDSSCPAVELQVNIVRKIQFMMEQMQRGTENPEVWQQLVLTFLVLLRRKRMRVDAATCLNESVLTILLRVLSKTSPEAALMLKDISPQTQTAMMRPPSRLYRSIDDHILMPMTASDSAFIGSPQGIDVLRKLASVIMHSALKVARARKGSAQERDLESRRSGMHIRQVRPHPLQASLTQKEIVLNNHQQEQQQNHHLWQLRQPPQPQQPSPSSSQPLQHNRLHLKQLQLQTPSPRNTNLASGRAASSTAASSTAASGIALKQGWYDNSDASICSSFTAISQVQVMDQRHATANNRRNNLYFV